MWVADLEPRGLGLKAHSIAPVLVTLAFLSVRFLKLFKTSDAAVATANPGPRHRVCARKARGFIRQSVAGEAGGRWWVEADEPEVETSEPNKVSPSGLVGDSGSMRVDISPGPG